MKKLVLVLGLFITLQAANASVISITSQFVKQRNLITYYVFRKLNLHGKDFVDDYERASATIIAKEVIDGGGSISLRFPGISQSRAMLTSGPSGTFQNLKLNILRTPTDPGRDFFTKDTLLEAIRRAISSIDNEVILATRSIPGKTEHTRIFRSSSRSTNVSVYDDGLALRIELITTKDKLAAEALLAIEKMAVRLERQMRKQTDL
jgi:hypothetical protein